MATIKQREAERHRKQDLAWNLSLAGANPREIAASKDPKTGKSLFVDARGAAQALKGARRRYTGYENGPNAPTIHELFDEDIERLNRMQRALFPAARAGDVNAAREVRQIIQTRAQLRGYLKGLEAQTSGTGDTVDDLTAKRDARRRAAG